MKILDITGLQHLWDKIKTFINNKFNQEPIAYIGTCTDEELKQAIAESDNTNETLNDKDDSILDPKIPRYEKRLRKVLWTNSNPSQEMGTGKLINLSSNDYDELEWVFAYSTTANNAISVNNLKGTSVHVVTMGYNNPTLIRRVINYVSDTQYKTSIAKFGDADNATMLIPLSVIGIKNS